MENLTEVRNSQGKLICRIDKPSKTIEIANKGYVTLISFCDNGNINVINKNKAEENANNKKQ